MKKHFIISIKDDNDQSFMLNIIPTKFNGVKHLLPEIIDMYKTEDTPPTVNNSFEYTASYLNDNVDIEIDDTVVVITSGISAHNSFSLLFIKELGVLLLTPDITMLKTDLLNGLTIDVKATFVTVRDIDQKINGLLAGKDLPNDVTSTILLLENKNNAVGNRNPTAYVKIASSDLKLDDKELSYDSSYLIQNNILKHFKTSPITPDDVYINLNDI